MTPNASRIAVLGLVDSVANGGVAIGGLVAPVLIEILGIRGALIASGLILPIVALLLTPALIGVPEGGSDGFGRVELVRDEPLFAPLSLATVEHLAAALTPVSFDDRAWIMCEGDIGLEYILIETGTAEVSMGGRAIRSLGPGDGAGEIALLREVPRTASVRAVGPVTAFCLDRADFLEAVTGHAASREVASAQIDARLNADTERPALH
jgi:hypothetical protein